MNAALLKDFRENIRSRFFICAGIVYIAALLIATGLALHAQAPFASSDANARNFGREHILSLLAIFGGALMLIAFAAMWRVFRERRRSAASDLRDATPPPAAALALGKLLSALALAGLFLCGGLPFILISCAAYGIDAPSALLCLYVIGGAFVVLVLQALLVGAIEMPLFVRPAAVLGFGFSGSIIIATVVVICKHDIIPFAYDCTYGREAYSYISELRDDAYALLTFINLNLAAATIIILLFIALVACLRPADSLRTRPLRIATALLAFFWAPFLALQHFFVEGHRCNTEQNAALLALLALFHLFIASSSERATPIPRQNANTPRNPAAIFSDGFLAAGSSADSSSTCCF
jgi:hypothetical protein